MDAGGGGAHEVASYRRPRALSWSRPAQGRTAEDLAGARNLVTREEVVRGYIVASPRVTRGRKRQPLIDHGIVVTRYQADWDAD